MGTLDGTSKWKSSFKGRTLGAVRGMIFFQGIPWKIFELNFGGTFFRGMLVTYQNME
jgi:hypothetical protein